MTNQPRSSCEELPGSVLLVTLDSCRFDSFVTADAPRMKSIGNLHRAEAPGYFTYSSHAAIFMGFTPGIASQAEAIVNPKFGKIFKLISGGSQGRSAPFYALQGANIIDGFKKKGFLTLGTAAVTWFDPEVPTGRGLTVDFDKFFYTGVPRRRLREQVAWLMNHLPEARMPVFAFLNVGETHVPYYYEGAPWRSDLNPCVPFAKDNDAGECRRRQVACVEWVDREIACLLERFRHSTVIICADHGDCWGEDGIWEHGVYHPKVVEVPLVIRLGQAHSLNA